MRDHEREAELGEGRADGGGGGGGGGSRMNERETSQERTRSGNIFKTFLPNIKTETFSQLDAFSENISLCQVTNL